MQTSPAVLVVTGAIVAVLAGCVTPATRSSGQLSSHAVNIPSEPANGIRVRGRCDIAPGRSGMASHALLVRVDMGRCHLTHLGAVRVEVENQFNLVLGTQSTQLMLTTADGAQVRMSVVGDSDGRRDPLRFNGAARVVGGTGRFSSATGAARTEGATAAGGEHGGERVLKIDGWITYPSAELSGTTEGGDR